MTAKDFWIDQTDPPYPQIRHRTYPSFDARYDTVYTLPGAKQQIKEICREHRNHWLAVRHRQVGQLVEEIIRDAIESRRTE